MVDPQFAGVHAGPISARKRPVVPSAQHGQPDVPQVRLPCHNMHCAPYVASHGSALPAPSGYERLDFHVTDLEHVSCPLFMQRRLALQVMLELLAFVKQDQFCEKGERGFGV